jgi:hypothetical protein
MQYGVGGASWQAEVEVQMIRTWILALAIAGTLGPGCKRTRMADDALTVRQLIDAPETFDGKRVKVTGCVEMGFETQGLYASCADKLGAKVASSLWLGLELNASTVALDGKVVVLEAVFDRHRRGHLAMRAGSLWEISGLRVLGER